MASRRLESALTVAAKLSLHGTASVVCGQGEAER